MKSASFLFAGPSMTASLLLFCAGLLLGAAVCYGFWHLRFRRMSREGNRDSVLESVPGMVVVSDPQGKLLYRNRQVVEYFGVRPEHLGKQADTQGWEFAEVVHPDGREPIVNEWRRCLKTGEAMVTTCRMRRWDGTYRWFERRAQPRRNDHNQIVCWYVLYFDIDDRKTAEDGLIASEQTLRLMTEAIPALVVRAAPAGNVDYVNQRVLDFVGSSLEDFINLTWAEFLHPDDVGEVRRRWYKALEDGTPVDTLFRFRRADGVYRWFAGRGNPLCDPDGKILNWYTVLLDIDDRKKAEEAIANSERNLRLLTETIPALVWRASPDGKQEYANQRFLDYIGKPREASSGMGWLQFIHPEDAGSTLRLWQAALESGTPCHLICRRRRADGVYRWFEVRGEPLRDSNGQVLSWYGVLIDIDDSKKAEEALVASERSLRLLIETIPAFVWRTSADGENDYSNQRLLNYTGGALEDYSGSGWLRGLHPDDVEETRRVFQRALETGIPYRTFFRLRRLDGVYRWFDVRGDPLRDKDGQIVSWYGLLFDIDDSRRMSEELRQTRSKLSRAMQLATVAELSASIAHEINQPLAAVMANGEACQTWLSKNPPNIERARRTAERVVRDGKSAAEVVSRIRRLFKQSAPVKTLLDLNGVIQEVIHLLSDEISKNAVTAETELDPALPTTMADRVQMQQVLLNLVSNAIESMEGSLGHSKVLSIRSGLQERHTIRIEVRDRGAGISDPESIFDPLYTTKENGMGMGLSICRTIVQAHGGHLWAARNQDVGTTMAFTLPWQQEAMG
jgi:PAS domain S-box-containing protein